MQAWFKPLQSLVAMIFTWIVGALLAGSATFATTSLVPGLSLADLVLFLTRFIAPQATYLSGLRCPSSG